MRSHPGPGDASRQRAEGQFKSSKKADLQTPLSDHRLREAEKTARLRALRLAKEAADKAAAEREAAAAIARRAEARRPIRRSQVSDPSEPE
jgi:hypothetical protein